MNRFASLRAKRRADYSTYERTIVPRPHPHRPQQFILRTQKLRSSRKCILVKQAKYRDPLFDQPILSKSFLASFLIHAFGLLNKSEAFSAAFLDFNFRSAPRACP